MSINLWSLLLWSLPILGGYLTRRLWRLTWLWSIYLLVGWSILNLFFFSLIFSEYGVWGAMGKVFSGSVFGLFSHEAWRAGRWTRRYIWRPFWRTVRKTPGIKRPVRWIRYLGWFCLLLLAWESGETILSDAGIVLAILAFALWRYLRRARCIEEEIQARGEELPRNPWNSLPAVAFSALSRLLRRRRREDRREEEVIEDDEVDPDRALSPGTAGRGVQ